MHPITRSTRAEAYQGILPLAGTMRARAHDALLGAPAGLTAEDVASVTGLSLNNARSRLTELVAAGQARVVGKVVSPRTGVRVALFKGVC